MISYKFKSPWLALNKENYIKYKNSSITERRELLKKILIGNILSMAKHLEYNIPDTVYADIELSAAKVLYKEIPMIGFKGVFEVNFLIPDYLGIGKAVSHGFGIVKRVSNN
ncbi:MAG: CRISPR-associated endonuclease Cas6 [Candidatus Odinarchaeota archaeon]